MTPKGKLKDLKRDSWRKALRKEKELITMRHFSLVSCKDSFRIIMALVAHYDLELHQMDVKTTFLNGHLEKMSIWHNRKVCRRRKRKYGMPPEEINLWIETSFKTVILEV